MNTCVYSARKKERALVAIQYKLITLENITLATIIKYCFRQES